MSFHQGKGKQNFVLFESAAGYALLEVVSADDVAVKLPEVVFCKSSCIYFVFGDSFVLLFCVSLLFYCFL